SYDSEYSPLGVAISGEVLLLNQEAIGLEILDIHTPSAPRRIGGYRYSAGFSQSSMGIWLQNGTAFLAGAKAGLQICQVTNPFKPQPLGSYDTAAFASTAAVSGHYAYLHGGVSGLPQLQVIDISNPASPQRCCS